VNTLVTVLGQDAHKVNQLLWDTYHPYYVWYPFADPLLERPTSLGRRRETPGGAAASR
jgi:hypothetical protein